MENPAPRPRTLTKATRSACAPPRSLIPPLRSCSCALPLVSRLIFSHVWQRLMAHIFRSALSGLTVGLGGEAGMYRHDLDANVRAGHHGAPMEAKQRYARRGRDQPSPWSADVGDFVCTGARSKSSKSSINGSALIVATARSRAATALNILRVDESRSEWSLIMFASPKAQLIAPQSRCRRASASICR